MSSNKDKDKDKSSQTGGSSSSSDGNPSLVRQTLEAGGRAVRGFVEEAARDAVRQAALQGAQQLLQGALGVEAPQGPLLPGPAAMVAVDFIMGMIVDEYKDDMDMVITVAKEIKLQEMNGQEQEMLLTYWYQPRHNLHKLCYHRSSV